LRNAVIAEKRMCDYTSINLPLLINEIKKYDCCLSCPHRNVANRHGETLYWRSLKKVSLSETFLKEAVEILRLAEIYSDKSPRPLQVLPLR